MRVRLLQDVIENGAPKQTVRIKRGKAWEWKKGAVLDMSDASARKYIDAGKAEPYTEGASAPAAE